MRLYHGSKSGIEGPIKPIGSSVNDFGRGFYLGDEPSQPLSLICRGERPTFYTCELNLAGYDMTAFVKAFMGSSAAEGLDADYDRMQWAGEAYVLESVVGEANLVPDSAAQKFDREALFWAGFIYRFWRFKTGESSRAIHARFPFADVLSVYPGFHTISNDRAVEEMIAIAERRAA